jgi:hypothetical protein
VALCAPAAFAGVIPVGYVSWDVNFPGNAGQFDITNLTGPNAAPTTFPIVTTVNLSDLNLVVDFVGGGTATFDPGTPPYFNLGPDGESFNGTSIPIGGTNPLPISATLTGTLSPLSISDPGSDNILSTFSVTISPDTGNSTLADGDFGVIFATEGTAGGGGGGSTPEPGTWLLLAMGMTGLTVARRTNKEGKRA